MSLPDNIFVQKIFLNALRTWEPSYRDDAWLKEIHYRSSITGTWRERYNEMRAAYVANKPEETKSYASPRDYLTTDDVLGFVTSILEEQPELNVTEWPLHQNTVVLGDILELSYNEKLFFNLAILLSSHSMEYSYNSVLSYLGMGDEAKEPIKFYSRLFNLTEPETKEAFNGFLVKGGLLTNDLNYKAYYSINPDLVDAFTDQNLTIERLEELLFPSNLKTELSVDHYPHIEKEIRRTEDIINQSMKATDSQGINLMFWGIPGTGKTELALALAKKNGWNLRVIGDISESNTEEKGRAQRLTSLKVAMKLYGRDSNTVLLFDEMEDLFKLDNNASFSKAFINRIIETTKIPIIWTTNELKSLGAAVLRRMVYNISFDVPPPAARKIMWKNYAKKYGVKLKPSVIEHLANNFDTVPALISNAVKITSMAKLPSDEIPEVVTSLDRLVHYGQERTFSISTSKDTPYDASCANTDIDLNDLTGRLLQCNPGFSMCLYGPPGTGKSEYGRHLAKKMNKQVLFKRASDLQSMWLGECEKNIAQAFKDAKSGEMVLIIDEGDSFLQNREKAQRSWEVSQVNEMLSQMETHTQPFIITTNLMKDLDPASLRRFTFKMKFDFMKPEQSRKLFKAYFGVKAPEALDRCEILAPGDFANVQRRAKILAIKDPQELYKMLMDECEHKPQKPGNPMGFRG